MIISIPWPSVSLHFLFFFNSTGHSRPGGVQCHAWAVYEDWRRLPHCVLCHRQGQLWARWPISPAHPQGEGSVSLLLVSSPLRPLHLKVEHLTACGFNFSVVTSVLLKLLSCFLSYRESFPMILVANKVDLVHLRKVTNEQGCEMAAKHSVGLSIHLHAIFYFFPPLVL